jgi:type III pantothenate kinase
MILAIDIGNTRTKAALFEESNIRQHWVFETARLETELSIIASAIPQGKELRISWISTSAPADPQRFSCWKGLKTEPVFIPIDAESPLPIRNKYGTPATLGTDRIVSVIAARELAGISPVLVVDAGTALTFDFANEKGEYLGGGISPGLAMRFRALNAFTARLPLVTDYRPAELIGDSTENSIRSGVLNGAVEEVSGIIQKYRERTDGKLKVFLTGGNALFFENQVKSINFVDADLVLKGIAAVVRSRNSRIKA